MRARLLLYTDVLSANLRSLLAESRGQGCPRDRGREGVLFFGDFLLDKQKKSHRRPGMVDESHTDVSRFSRSAEERRRWIPAFAGMTE